VQPLLANDTLQEVVVAFYDKQGQLTSKVSFIVQVPSYDSNTGSNSTAAANPETILPWHPLLAHTRMLEHCVREYPSTADAAMSLLLR
jgi:hypothetical protein